MTARGSMWDCSSPRYSNGTFCNKKQERSLDEEAPRAYIPRSGSHFYYRNELDRGHPPVAVMIPPGTSDARSYIVPRAKTAGMCTDITVESNDNVSSKLSDEGITPCLCSCKRGFWCLAFAVLVLAAGIFSIGIGVGIGVRNKRAIDTVANSQEDRGSPIKQVSSSSNSTDILVGAYYYPWHGSNFHNGDGYIRSQLVPPHSPTLGEYDDSKPETISQHLGWSRQANIGLWITSWWGPGRLEDSNTKDVILQHEELGDMKIALHYETTGRVRNGNLENVRSDIEYICDTYFDHENYYKIDGRPVIFVYVTRKLDREGYLEETILTMRSTANKCGQNIYIVGDHVFQDPPDVDSGDTFKPFFYFDAVTNYDMYGSMGSDYYYAGTSAVTEFYSEQRGWKDLAAEHGCRYMPTVSPGFNDRGVRFSVDHQPLSRKLTANSVEGSLFALAIEQARRLVDPEIDNLLLVNSFNEWHEDTQIEPCVGPITRDPKNLTKGVEYAGYGELYLNLLREGTRTLDQPTTDNIFTDGEE